MIVPFIILSLSCAETKLENVSGLPWNKYDKSILTQAKKRCGELYSDAPCVSLFRKYAFQQYSVICGAEKDKKDNKTEKILNIPKQLKVE